VRWPGTKGSRVAGVLPDSWGFKASPRSGHLPTQVATCLALDMAGRLLGLGHGWTIAAPWILVVARSDHVYDQANSGMF
jgi:hypothetical protein